MKYFLIILLSLFFSVFLTAQVRINTSTDVTSIFGETGNVTAKYWHYSNHYMQKVNIQNAYNKNFGLTAGTVAQGNDIRILNGQTAFSWGNHSLQGYLTTDNNTQLSKEQVQDYIGTMFTGNTETRISANYDDAANEIDFVVDAETDPNYNTSAASGITAIDINNWNASIGANQNVQSDWLATVGDAFIKNKPTTISTAQINKIAGIESNATADQSPAEIKTSYESNTNTNVFTDAEKTKLALTVIGAHLGLGTTSTTALSGNNKAIIDANTTKRHDALTLSSDALAHGLSLSGQELDYTSNANLNTHYFPSGIADASTNFDNTDRTLYLFPTFENQYGDIIREFRFMPLIRSTSDASPGINVLIRAVRFNGSGPLTYTTIASQQVRFGSINNYIISNIDYVIGNNCDYIQVVVTGGGPTSWIGMGWQAVIEK